MIIQPEVVLLLLKVTALFAIAFVIERTLLRRTSAAVRHLVWTSTVLGVLVLPLLSTSLPRWGVLPLPAAHTTQLTPATSATAVSTPNDDPSAISGRSSQFDGVTRQHASNRDAALESSNAKTPDAAADYSTSPSSDAPAATASMQSRSWRWLDPTRTSSYLISAWAAIALVLIARLAVEQRTIRRLSRDAECISSGAIYDSMQSIARMLRIDRRITLLKSAAPIMPVTWGVLRPRVLVPADFDAWPVDRQRAVLMHELAHVARHDCLTQMLAAAACAAWWFHPAAWFAARRLRVEREIACDDRVLLSGMSSHDYARHLLEIARASYFPASVSTLAVNMATPSNLENRMLATIDRHRSRTTPGARGTLAAILVTASTLIPTAVLHARTDAADLPTVPATVPVAEREPEAILRLQQSSTSIATATPATTRATDMANASSTTSRSSNESTSSSTSEVQASSAAARAGGSWRMREASPGERLAGEPSVHVMLMTNGMNTFVVKQSQLSGFSPELLNGGESRVSFRIVRDAGTLEFSGDFRNKLGSGAFEFLPNEAFADSLIARGMTRPTASQQFSMGLHDVGLDLLNALQSHGYQRPTTEQLMRVGLTSVDVQYIRDMSAIGYQLGTVGGLVELTNHSINAAYISRMNAAAGRRMSASELLALRRSGNDKRLLASSSGAVTTASVGTPTTPAPATSRNNNTPVAGRWLLRSTRGMYLDIELQWDDDTQWRRSFTEVEFSGLPMRVVLSPTPTNASFSIEQSAGRLVFDGTLQNGQGSGPFRFIVNRRYIDTLRTLGVSGTGDVTDHDLKNLTYGRMSASTVRELQAIGYRDFSMRELTDAAVFGVTPEFARAVRAAEMVGSNTLSGVADLKHSGVNADFVGGLAELGYRNLSADEARALMRAGVTVAFVRQLHESGTRNLTVDELIARRKR